MIQKCFGPDYPLATSVLQSLTIAAIYSICEASIPQCSTQGRVEGRSECQPHGPVLFRMKDSKTMHGHFHGQCPPLLACLSLSLGSLAIQMGIDLG